MAGHVAAAHHAAQRSPRPSPRPNPRPIKTVAAGGDDLGTFVKASAYQPQPPEPLARTGFLKYQSQAASIYNDIRVQISVAVLICLNFLCNIVEKQIDPAGEDHSEVFEAFELAFNIAFTVELGLNMYGTWFRKFWSSGWNNFDFVVVSIGIMITFNVPLPGPFAMLRMMRAFRVFRLFKRVQSLNKIMTSLAKAVPGVLNAFLILFIVMCIYAILAVDFFMDYGEGGSFTNAKGDNVELKTGRGLDFGEEYFGRFDKALYSMFQVLTGESWSEAIARPLLHGEDTFQALGSGAFFVSFVLICAIVLINVVVAVLLEKMVDDEADKGDVDGPDSNEDARAISEGDDVGDAGPSDAKALSAEVTTCKEDVAAVREQLEAIITRLQRLQSGNPGMQIPGTIDGQTHRGFVTAHEDQHLRSTGNVTADNMDSAAAPAPPDCVPLTRLNLG